MNNNKKDLIIIHGILMPRHIMAYLKHALSPDFNCHLFGYPSRTQSLDTIAELLHQFIEKKNITVNHFVAHSMGGLVMANYLQKYRPLPMHENMQEKVAAKDQATSTTTVALGSPLAGSCVAEYVATWKIGKLLLGTQHCGDLVNGIDAWPQGHSLGCVVGTKSFGICRVLPLKALKNSDSTVTIEETQIAGIEESIQMPFTHLNMIFSKQVAMQANAFLQHRAFVK